MKPDVPYSERPKRLLTIDEVAFQLSLSKSKVYELLNNGSIRVVKIGRSRRVSPGDLDLFIEKSKTSKIINAIGKGIN